MIHDWESTRKHLLLTGSPGCGKTTVLIRFLERLGGRSIRGFTTAEVREGNRRVGFTIRTLGGREGLLSHIRFGGPHRVSRYGVDVVQFEHLVLPELSPGSARIEGFLIDEIGKMECFSDRFIEAVRKILKGPIPVVATVAAKGGGFISEVKTLSNVTIVRVTPGNRDELPEQIARWFEHRESHFS
jgi:nucleoside-triphosphatase THEP1